MNDPKESIFSSFPEIETERLLLREILPSDTDSIYRIFSDPYVTQYYDLETYTSLQQAQELIDFFDESFELERAIRWGITQKTDDIVIGTCGYVWLRQHRSEIGYELAQPYWRQGFMSEALDAILEFGFEQLRLNRIEALVMTANLPSTELLLSLGFQEEGILRQHDFFKDQFHDMRLLSILYDDYYDQ